MALVDGSTSSDTRESSTDASDVPEEGNKASDEGSEVDEDASSGLLARARTVCSEAVGVVVDAVLDAL